MTTINPIFLTTIEESLRDDACGMQYWYDKFEGGTGILARKDILANHMLAATQSDLRTIAELPDLSKLSLEILTQDILSKLTPEDRRNTRAMELLYRRLGWMNAYALFIEPAIRRIYLTVTMDEEIQFERPPLTVTIRPGRVLKHRQTNEIEVREYIPTAYSNAKWRDSWEWHIRPHLNLLATREKLMRKMDFARIGGLHLGITSAIENAQLRHPYVYGNYNRATAEWTHRYQSASVDWVERPLWEYPGSLTEWVMNCGMTTAETQFPLSPRIPLNGPIVDAWVNRRTFRERTIRPLKVHAQNNKLLRVLHFAQNSQVCSPLHSAPCAFKELCWNEPFLSSAIQQTKYTPKVSAAPAVRLWRPPLTLSEQVEQAIKEGEMEAPLNILKGDQTPLPDDSSDLDPTLPIIDLTPLLPKPQLSA